jgi:hypothetical protein
MHLEVTPLSDQGRRLSKDEFKFVVHVNGDVRMDSINCNGRTVHRVICIEGKNMLPMMIYPTVTGAATLALEIQGFEPVNTPQGWSTSVALPRAMKIYLA